MLTESLGSGRHIPVKEGPVKKKSSGMRPEWKKKYLVLSQTELTYYPTLTVCYSLSLSYCHCLSLSCSLPPSGLHATGSWQEIQSQTHHCQGP